MSSICEAAIYLIKYNSHSFCNIPQGDSPCVCKILSIEAFPAYYNAKHIIFLHLLKIESLFFQNHGQRQRCQWTGNLYTALHFAWFLTKSLFCACYLSTYLSILVFFLKIYIHIILCDKGLINVNECASNCVMLYYNPLVNTLLKLIWLCKLYRH